MVGNLFRQHGLHHPSRHSDNYGFRPSAPMFHNGHPSQHSRLLRNNDMEFFFNNSTILSNSFQHLHINHDNSDDDDDDDDGQTPTVELPSPKYPK